jgi:hypothetical protein
LKRNTGFLVLVVTLTALLDPRSLNAQGVTSGVIQGRVTTRDGIPVPRAQVSVEGTANGERWERTTSAGGRFYFDQIAVGGPYRLEVRAIGFAPLTQDSLFLSLGHPRNLLLVVSPIAVSLPEVTVVSDARVGATRTGPAQTIPETTLTRLPVIGRDVTFAALLSPQVARSPTGGLTFGGHSSLLNSLQIDGSNNNDLLAVLLNGSTGIPTIGNGSDARLPIEAIKELQVVSAPFDVRFGNFGGGLINAVTRSGTDRLQGSIFGYFENQELAGATSANELLADFSISEAGFTLGGPIKRSRAYFFLAGDIRRTIAPREAVLIGSDTTNGADSAGVGIRYTSLVRYQNILKNVYGLDAGTNIRRSNRSAGGHVLAKVTVPLGINQRLEVSHDFMPTWFRTTSGYHAAYGSYGLSSGGWNSPETGNVTRLTYAAALGPRLSNEAKLARMSDRVRCSGATYPEMAVSADQGLLSAGDGSGTGFGCAVDQSLWEFGYNLGIDLGAHHVTLGTHDELSHLRTLEAYQFPGFWARWTFSSLDSLEQRRPSGYSAVLRNPIRPSGPLGDFNVNQLGFYIQDQWSATARLFLTAGARVDVPLLPSAPPRNPTLQQQLGINTSVSPGGNPSWSPRFGWSYDLRGEGTAYVRGGLGLFAGRPPYSWFNEPFINTGLERVGISCNGVGRVPAFTADLPSQPRVCADGTQGSNAGLLASVFSPEFKLPRYLKVALGLDRRARTGWIASADLLISRGVDTYYLTDANLLAPLRLAAGEGGRVMYGSVDQSSGEALPNRRSHDFGQVALASNSAGDRTLSASLELQRRFDRGAEIRVSYAFTRSRDRLSAPDGFIFFNLNQSALDGTLERRNLTTSEYEVPHKVTALAVVNFPFGLRGTLSYEGHSGSPYSFTVDGDANADGIGIPGFNYSHNDLVYVPTNRTDVSLADPADWTKLESFIESESCLDRHRGRILRRNSCRNPWVNATNLRLSKVLGLGGTHSTELTADLFNVLRLANSKWGLVRTRASYFDGSADLLGLVGYDAARDRGVYRVLDSPVMHTDLVASRWRIQLSARYTF